VLNTEEVSGGWRRLHDEELLKFHAARHIIRTVK
jgi:hypothetical protein